MKALFFILLLVMPLFASESATLASRSVAQYRLGNFPQAQILGQRAILAARKETNTLNEAKGLVNMASYLIFGRDYVNADSLLSEVPETKDKLLPYLVALERSRANKGIRKYAKSRELLNSLDRPQTADDDLRERMDKVYAQLLLEKAELAARTGDGDAESHLKAATQILGPQSGRLLYTRARVLYLAKRYEAALQLYSEALVKAHTKLNRTHVTGNILFEMALCREKQGEIEEAQNLFRRSMDAFEQSGLGLPFIRSGIKYLSLNPDDYKRSGKVSQAKNEFAGEALEFLLLHLENGH